MYVWVEPFLQICLFKRSPADLPASVLLLILVSLSYVLVTAVMILPYFSVAISFLQAIVDLLVLTTYSWVVLVLVGYPNRWLQTVIALIGSGALLTTLMLPLLYNAGTEPGVLFALGYLIAAGWLLLLYAHLFRLALSTRSLGIGMLFTLGYLLLSSKILQSLFPAPAAVAG